MGSYNRDTAIGYSITVDADIRLDTYLASVFRADRENWAKLDRQHRAKQKANYEAIKERIISHPEGLDIMSGNGLNAVLEQLNDPKIQESSFRAAPVVVPVAMIRRIPFKLDEKGVIFSMQRLTARGKGKWPVAFQSDRYAFERKAFERAIDDALEKMIDGKMLPETIAAYEAAVRELSARLEDEYGRSTDRRYQEGKSRINEMEKATMLLKTLQIQPVMAELDRYAGTTVNDLRLFMRAHNLRFAQAESAEERRLFPELYAALVQVRDIVTDPGKGQEK
jgi:hypothetical protein